jgi:hypothetical protein
MYRVIAIIAGALTLAACSSMPEWLSLDALKPAPAVDTVRFESEPPGAEAKTSNGQTCRTPCALALPADAPLTVTFTLTGYQAESESIDPISQSGGAPEMRPNPVIVQLTPLPPPAKPIKKPAKKPVAKKPAAKPAPRAAAKPAAQPAAAAAPMTAAPADQAPAPWPAAPKQ